MGRAGSNTLFFFFFGGHPTRILLSSGCLLLCQLDKVIEGQLDWLIRGLIGQSNRDNLVSVDLDVIRNRGGIVNLRAGSSAFGTRSP